jgi:signal transduction histidine kinase
MVSEAPEKFSSSGHLIETKILVCEDNADMNRFISQILSPSAHIFSAMNGQEALSMAKTISPDLIVSDVMMPSMIGDQLVAELQKNPTLKQIPILLLSARADEEMRIRLLKEGASDYLVKPFSPEELKVRANNLLQMKLARDLLQKELSSKSQNVVDLVQEMSERKRETELAFEVTKAARAEAEKSSQVKSAFLSLVSHELNTPLMTLSLGVQILQNALKNQIDTKQQEVLSRLSRSVKQLKALIEGLLEYVRSGHPEKLKTEEVNISRLLKDLKDEFQITADSKGLQLSLDLSDSDLMIESDLTKLKVILSNLVVNAIKFTQKGEVKISAQESGRLIEIRVKDSGPGISQQDQQRIFEPFEQIEPLERKTIPGIGLGLSLVKQLADVLHAEITLVSEVGQGSEFGVKLHKRASAHPMNKD